MSMPIPGGNRRATPATQQAPPTPEETRDHDKELEEVSFILRSILTPEHRDDIQVLRFISSYVRCRHTSQAAREAGIHGGRANSLRRKPDIHEAIAKLTERSLDKYGFNADEVVERVKEFLFVDPVDVENADGSYKERLSDIPPETRRAIKKMKLKNIYDKDINGMPIVSGKIIEIEFYDKLRSAEMLGPEKGILKKTSVVEHSATADMKAILLGGVQRANERIEAMREEREALPPPKGDTDDDT